MKIRKIMIPVILSLLSCSAFADDDGYYIGTMVGASMPQSLDTANDSGITATYDPNTGYSWGAVVGRQFGDIRGEVEFSYRDENADVVITDGVDTDNSVVDHRAYSAMFNGYYDFRNGSSFTPYLGAGAGLIHSKSELVETTNFIGTSGKDTSLAYQGMAGVNLALSDDISVGLGYRYLGTSSNEEFASNTHEVLGSMMFKLD
jgi:opacity protein-like surface antigen